MTKKELELAQLDMLLYFDYKYNIPKCPELDNEVYYPAYYSDKRYNLVWGGRGSGKSFDIEGKLPIVLISSLPFCRILMVRQVFDSIKGSQFQEIIDYIAKWELEKYFKVTTSPMRITHIESGNYISFAGMDKPQSLKSIKDITHIIFGEAFQIKSEEGFDTVDKSVRTPLIDQTKIYVVFNPDNDRHWIYDKFFNEELSDQYEYYREDLLSINTTHWDNKFVPFGFRQLIEKDRVANPERYKVDGLGQWGKLKSLNAYYINFKSETAIISGLQQSKYDPNKALHITFDFNVFPYITLEIIQVIENPTLSELQVCHITEICLNEKQHGREKVGRIEETCYEFLRQFAKHRGNVYVYGDRSGHNKKTNAVSDYSTVFAVLGGQSGNKNIRTIDANSKLPTTSNPYPLFKQLGCTFVVHDMTNKSSNPRHEVRKVFFRRMQAGVLSVSPVSRKLRTQNAAGDKRELSVKYGEWKISQFIDSKCQFLINDYQGVEEAEDGTKDSRNKNLTHCSDAVDYFYCMYFDAEFDLIEAELKK